jgi:uncharacterized protein (DUF302 family)
MTDSQNAAEISGLSIGLRVVHQRFVSSIDFDTFTGNLERILGRFDPAGLALVATSPAEAADRIRKMEGEQGLMIFLILDHGGALNMVGKKQKAKQYLIGNPLTAIQMTSHQIGAALYAPLRVLIYESAAGEAVAEYDQITSLVQQFDDAEVSSVAATLDTKLPAVLRRAVELSGD